MSTLQETNIIDEHTSSQNKSENKRRSLKPSRELLDQWNGNSRDKVEVKKSKSSKNTTKQNEPQVPIDKTAAVEISTSTPAVCGYCQQSHQDGPLESGKMFSIAGETCHYFCQLFTVGSAQLGADNEGLFGFYGDEVKKQISLAKKRKCKYCSKPGATAKCSKKYCGVYMHFPCGQANGATFQFYGKMLAYCQFHRIKQKTEHCPTPPDSDCVICYEKVETKLEDFKKLRAPCCGRHLHKDCVQRFAMSSGTQHFKCPNCNNQAEISKEFSKMGIYLPYKDAEWELPDQSDFYNFQDMYIQTKRCCLKDCQCKDGRDFNDVDGDFEIVLCDLCGTNGVHMKCGNINEETLDYICADCGGNMPLEENTSRMSSTIRSSLNSSASSIDSSFSVECETSLTMRSNLVSTPDPSSRTIPNVRDFIKQFEVSPTNSTSVDSLLKSSDSESSSLSLNCTLEGISEMPISKPPKKKRGPKSKTKVCNNPVNDVKTKDTKSGGRDSKADFFKHTEELSRMLEDIKKRDLEKKSKEELEKKSKEAFLSLMKESITSGKTDSFIGQVVESPTDLNMEAKISFGKFLTQSLEKLPFEPSRKLSDKENESTVEVKYLKVRTDLIAKGLGDDGSMI